MIKKALFALSAVAVIATGAALAQQTAIKRTPLQKVEFPEGFVSVSGIAEVPAGAFAATPIRASSSAMSSKARSISLWRASRTSI
jgi:hypothetical protein